MPAYQYIISKNVNIKETEFGLALTISDLDLADEFDDFLSADVYVLYNQKLDSQETTFYFGQVACTDKLKEIYDMFVVQKG